MPSVTTEPPVFDHSAGGAGGVATQAQVAYFAHLSKIAYEPRKVDLDSNVRCAAYPATEHLLGSSVHPLCVCAPNPRLRASFASAYI